MALTVSSHLNVIIYISMLFYQISITKCQSITLQEVGDRLTILEKNTQTRISALEKRNDDFNKHLKKVMDMINKSDLDKGEKISTLEEDAEQITNLLKTVNATLETMSHQMRNVSFNVTQDQISIFDAKVGTYINDIQHQYNEDFHKFNESVQQQIQNSINERANLKLDNIDEKMATNNIILLSMFSLGILIIGVTYVLKYKKLRKSVKAESKSLTDKEEVV